MTQDIKKADAKALEKKKKCSATGSTSTDFRNNLIRQLSQSLGSSNLSHDEGEVLGASVVDVMEAIGPKNEVEGMLVAQLITTHSAAMDCFKRAANPNYSFEEQQKSLGCANKLVRSYAVLVESLERGRGKGGNEQMIVSLWEGIVEGQMVQIIRAGRKTCEYLDLSSLRGFIEDTFDFEICKCVYNGNAVELLGGAEADFENETMTTSMSALVRNKRLFSLPKRSAKLKTQFPNFEIVMVE